MPPRHGLSARLSGSDLLLVLIVTLGSLRLLLPIVIDLALNRAAVRDETTMLALSLFGLTLQSLLLLAVIVLFVVGRRGVSWDALGLRPASLAWIGRSILIALVAIPTVGIVNAAMQILIGGKFVNPQIEALAPIGASWTSYLATLALATSLVPFAEELAFRGLLYGWLRERCRLPAAVAWSALAFALLHGIPNLIPALCLMGVMLALLYEKSGSLWPAVVMHGCFNALMTTLLYAALASDLQLAPP